jgi:vacuolar-type H+-ATPase subunit I/STV1
VYIIVFQEGAQVRRVLTRICDSFMGERFEIPHGNINEKIMDITQKIGETENIMAITRKELTQYLHSINHIEGNVRF